MDKDNLYNETRTTCKDKKVPDFYKYYVTFSIWTAKGSYQIDNKIGLGLIRGSYRKKMPKY